MELLSYTSILSTFYFYANFKAPINVMPHRPSPGQCWGIGGEIGGDLNFAKFKCTTYWECQSVKSQPSPHLIIEEKMGNLTVDAFNCSTCIW